MLTELLELEWKIIAGISLFSYFLIFLLFLSEFIKQSSMMGKYVCQVSNTHSILMEVILAHKTTFVNLNSDFEDKWTQERKYESFYS